MNKREKIVEILRDQVSIKSFKSVREIADAIMELDEAEARERYEKAIQFIAKQRITVKDNNWVGFLDEVFKIASGLTK